MISLHRFLLPALLATLTVTPAQIRWACIGNSITAGYPNVNLAYPPVLKTKLTGVGDTVLNAGVSAKTLMKGNADSYWTGGRLPQVFAFKPNVITLKLGTNDTKPQYWNSTKYRQDLIAMIDTLSTISPKPRIFLCLPPPIWTNTFGIRDTIMTDSIIPIIQQVAVLKGLSVMDFNTAFRGKPSLFNSDGVHLTNASRDSVANMMYRYYVSFTTSVTSKTQQGKKPMGGGLRAVTKGTDLSTQASGMDPVYSLDGKAVPPQGKDPAAGVYWQAKDAPKAP
jgi:acyl-CoA thioesterase-1